MNDEPDITWELRMGQVPDPAGARGQKVDLKFTGQDWDAGGAGTFEIWLEGREDEPAEGEPRVWEDGATLTRGQAAKLHRFLGAWLAAGGER